MNEPKDGEELISEPIDIDGMSADQRIKLGPFIRQRRLDQGMSMNELAEAAEVDRKTLRTIESGARAGQPAKLRSLLAALNVAQPGDYDRFSERTRAFIYATAPVFELLPDDVKADAQNDIVVLLTGKLHRVSGIPSIGVGDWRDDVEMEEVAGLSDYRHEEDEDNYDA